MAKRYIWSRKRILNSPPSVVHEAWLDAGCQIGDASHLQWITVEVDTGTSFNWWSDSTWWYDMMRLSLSIKRATPWQYMYIKFPFHILRPTQPLQSNSIHRHVQDHVVRVHSIKLNATTHVIWITTIDWMRGWRRGGREREVWKIHRETDRRRGRMRDRESHLRLTVHG